MDKSMTQKLLDKWDEEDRNKKPSPFDFETWFEMLQSRFDRMHEKLDSIEEKITRIGGSTQSLHESLEDLKFTLVKKEY